MSTTINTSTSNLSAITSLGSAGAGNSQAVSDASAAQDRFLKLLVAQLNNQDPMNPMDNAQMTSQMAQINTVSGIQQLNTTVKSLSDQFSAMQMMQGANLIGHDVLVEGSTLPVKNGVAQGAIELASNADSVKVEILDSGGKLLDTLSLGPQTSGRHDFSWNAPASSAATAVNYRVTATQGSNTVSSTSLTRASVQSVGQSNGALQLSLSNGQQLAYTDIKAML